MFLFRKIELIEDNYPYLYCILMEKLRWLVGFKFIFSLFEFKKAI